MTDERANSPWTDRAIEMLKKLWPEPGMSCASIANELGNGITRNAVIGKGTRLGLGPKPSNHARTNTAKRLTAKPTRVHTENINRKRSERNFGSVWGAYPNKEPEPFVPRAADIVSRGIDVLDLTEETCKWPDDKPEGEQHTFCGHTAAPGKPYCQGHCLIAFYKPAKRSPAQKAWDAKLNQRTARRTPDAQAWIAEEVAA
jgi:GcrA cell cycle regulator